MITNMQLNIVKYNTYLVLKRNKKIKKHLLKLLKRLYLL